LSVVDTPGGTPSTDWDWPGSRWWRCDLHIHTPNSHDFSGAGVTPVDIIQAAAAAGLHTIAVTDHNTVAFVDELEAAADLATPRLVVFAGTEITSNEGAHLLVLFPPGSSADTVKGYLGACGIPGDKWGKDDAHASVTYAECIVKAEALGAVCIAAHADRPATEGKKHTSLLHAIAGQGLLDVLALPELHAAEVTTTNGAAHTQLRALDPLTSLPLRPCLAGSDAHSLQQIGQTSSWIKMSRPEQEGLRLAFADGEMSVVIAAPGDDPNRHASFAIESITISDGKLMGRGEPFVLALNPWLNALIGGRGTGKSSVVEFLRLALRREDELPRGLQETFNEFAKMPANRNDRGLLTPSTHLSIVYRKDASRFRIQWRQDGKAPPIEEDVAGAWTEAEGAVAERFPARIYSQKQIFELAEGPESLLRVIDESAQVNRIEWEEQRRTAEAEFLSLRAQARQLEAQLAEEGRLRGHLDDVNKKLAVFESSNHRDILRAYRQRQDQLRAVGEWERELQRVTAELRAAATTTTASFETGAFDADDNADAELLAAIADEQQSLDKIRKQVEAATSAADALTKRWKERKRTLAWAQVAEEASHSYAELLERLKAEGAGSPDEYADLVRDREGVTTRLEELDQMRKDLTELDEQAAQALAHLLDLRRDLTQKRHAFLGDVLATNTHVRIKVIPYGDRASAEPGFRSLIGREPPSFQNDISSPEGTGLIPSLYANFEAGDGRAFEQKLDRLRDGVRACARSEQPNWTLRDRRFAEHLRGLAPETVDRLAYWSPPDTVEVFYSRSVDGSGFLPIQQGSPGQKTAAILAFLLAYGDEPIVLDQPEDDLDNTLIYDLIVQQLRENKQRRQIIVVTHNANIVVNGDAEFVAALDFVNGQTRIVEEGGLQERNVREAVCEIMEGGRPAFEQRYQRIGRHI
jgi:AAA domain, putative AbiEii toxin, Type IV TA system